MSTTLRDFVLNAVEMNRIRYADLRRLQRDILPVRITTQQEAEMLLSLDATVERADRDWREYLVPAVAQFVVWGLEPPRRSGQSGVAPRGSGLGAPENRLGHHPTRRYRSAVDRRHGGPAAKTTSSRDAAAPCPVRATPGTDAVTATKSPALPVEVSPRAGGASRRIRYSGRFRLRPDCDAALRRLTDG